MNFFKNVTGSGFLPTAGNRARNVHVCFCACGSRKISGPIFAVYVARIFIITRCSTSGRLKQYASEEKGPYISGVRRLILPARNYKESCHKRKIEIFNKITETGRYMHNWPVKIIQGYIIQNQVKVCIFYILRYNDITKGQ